MSMIVGLAGVGLIILVIVESFESIVVPRRVTHRFRFTRLFYNTAWRSWSLLGRRISNRKNRESFLSLFGPMSLLALLAIWVLGLIFGFAMLHWALQTRVHAPDAEMTFPSYLYWSGGTFFTLGYGDMVPSATLGRALAVLEAGMGFGFLAMILSYLPVTYQTYSKREILIALLDARAGSPASAAQLLSRAGQAGNIAALDPFLAEWERWSAELLESHLSFPLLSYYRSQHDNQSWLLSLTTVLDTCAVYISLLKEQNLFQAKVTFAMARHAAVDLGLVFKVRPVLPEEDRLPWQRIQELRKQLTAAGFTLQDAAADAKLTELRGMYEPFVNALAKKFLFALPAIVPQQVSADNWQRSAWMKRTPEFSNLTAPLPPGDTHFR